MTRDGERSRIVFPGLLVLALLLFGIPETHVDAARTRAYSILSPVLKRFTAWRSLEPRVACVQVLEPATTVTPEKPATAAQAQIDPVQHDKLVSENAFLRSQLEQLKQSQHLPDLPSLPPPGLASSIIERKILWQEPLLGIDKGSEDGVRQNCGVLHRGAVLGRIVSVAPHASSLALLTHRGVSIAARLGECRIEGVLQGGKEENGIRVCRLSIVSREAAPKIGENVVTTGYDGAFPPGLWMGVVTAIKKTADFQWELTVRPACNDNAVEIVEVISGPLPEVPWPVAPNGKKAVGRKQ